MTCIVGLKYKDNIYMGADSAGTNEWDKCIRADPKVFTLKYPTNDNKLKPMIIGFTTSYRFGQILRYHLDLPIKNKDQDPYDYVVKLVIPEVRSKLKEHGFMKVSESVEEGGTFLIGIEKRIFRVGGDFNVGERQEEFDACGCGESYALAYLKTVENFEDSNWELLPEQKIGGALGMSAYFSCGVFPPYIVEVIE